MAHYFITSTGTNIGKTLVTAALTAAMRNSGKHAEAIKPIISGYEFGKESDLDLLCLAQGLNNDEASHKSISLHRFSPALSPDMILRDEGKSLDVNGLLDFIKGFKNSEHLLVEGVGGAFAPLDAGYTNYDLIRDLGYKAILVCGSYLGSLSHTIATYSALKNGGINIKAIIVTENIRENDELYISPAETVKSLSNFISENIIVLKRIEGSGLEKISKATQELNGAIDGL
jgi:dethiobiotin synthetase